jgi:hypothetical protein
LVLLCDSIAQHQVLPFIEPVLGNQTSSPLKCRAKGRLVATMSAREAISSQASAWPLAKQLLENHAHAKPQTGPYSSTPISNRSLMSLEQPRAVIPKGLRSFEAEDAEFFLELLPGPRDRHGLPECIRTVPGSLRLGRNLEVLAELRGKYELLDQVNDTLLAYLGSTVGAGRAFFDQVVAAGHEGVMAKKHTSCYLAGQRSSSWRKIKPELIVPCVIIGYQAGRSGVQRLCVAAVREEGLRYVGQLTLGFTATQAVELEKRLAPLGRSRPALSAPGLLGRTGTLLPRAKPGLDEPRQAAPWRLPRPAWLITY